MFILRRNCLWKRKGFNWCHFLSIYRMEPFCIFKFDVASPSNLWTLMFLYAVSAKSIVYFLILIMGVSPILFCIVFSGINRISGTRRILHGILTCAMNIDSSFLAVMCLIIMFLTCEKRILLTLSLHGLWNSRAQRLIHKGLPIITILNRINPTSHTGTYFSKIH
jgi:hypothetical protein